MKDPLAVDQTYPPVDTSLQVSEQVQLIANSAISEASNAGAQVLYVIVPTQEGQTENAQMVLLPSLNHISGQQQYYIPSPKPAVVASATGSPQVKVSGEYVKTII